MTGDQTGRSAAFAFGPFRLLPQQRQLLRDDTPLNVPSRVWAILLALLERAGEVVTNRQLLARVWPGIVVEQGAIRVHIAGLRKLLEDGKSDGLRYVETVTGQGYRFIAPVTTFTEESAASFAPWSVDEPQYNAPLPPLRILGREHVLATLATSLLNEPLVTIVGPGGVGKTTVAMAAACRAATDSFAEVCTVDLGSIVAPALVQASIASALGLTNVPADPTPSIVSFLKLRRMLLVLDSCEHVVEVLAPVVEQLLALVPGLHILATSREQLRIGNETVLWLPPLEIPALDAVLTADDALGYSAIELFARRALESQATFELQDNDVAIVAEICRKLDGLPLAIELAAARVDVFGLRALAVNLDDQLQLLTKGHRTALPRHQTLRATIDWSYETLSSVEQIALRRLAVFAGSFSVESARELIADDVIDSADVLDLIMNLVAKSLLKSSVVRASIHFHLLQTSRAYAFEKLESSNESALIHRRHAQLCCTWGEAALDWEPEDTQDCIASSNRKIHDIRAALEWCFSATGDAAVGARLAAASGAFWFQLCFLDEYRGYLERALQFLRTAPASQPSLELQLTEALGQVLVLGTGFRPGVTDVFRRTSALAEQSGALPQHRNMDLIIAGDYHAAVVLAEEFGAKARMSDCPQSVLTWSRMMTLAHHLAGNQVTAREHAERLLLDPARPAAPLRYRAQQFDHQAAGYAELARILWIQGFPEQARHAGEKSLQRAVSIDHPLSLCRVLNAGCTVTLWMGDKTMAELLAARLIECSSRHSLAYWILWGRCLRIALAPPDSRVIARLRRDLIHDPLCTPLYLDHVATLNEGLITQTAIERAHSGLAGACTPEILRVEAETLLRSGAASPDVLEGMLERSLSVAREQGALSWELRAAMSLSRLRSTQGFAHDAHELLQSVYSRFSEGFDTADLVAARALLEELRVSAARRSAS